MSSFVILSDCYNTVKLIPFMFNYRFCSVRTECLNKAFWQYQGHANPQSFVSWSLEEPSAILLVCMEMVLRQGGKFLPLVQLSSCEGLGSKRYPEKQDFLLPSLLFTTIIQILCCRGSSLLLSKYGTVSLTQSYCILFIKPPELCLPMLIQSAVSQDTQDYFLSLSEMLF